jgi:hypothetical protein
MIIFLKIGLSLFYNILLEILKHYSYEEDLGLLVDDLISLWFIFNQFSVMLKLFCLLLHLLSALKKVESGINFTILKVEKGCAKLLKISETFRKYAMQ